MTEYSSRAGVDYVDLNALPDDRSGFVVEVTRDDIHVEVKGMARPVFEWWAIATSDNVGGAAQDLMDYRYGEGWDDDEYDRLMARDLGYSLYGITNLTLRLDPHPKKRKKLIFVTPVQPSSLARERRLKPFKLIWGTHRLLRPWTDMATCFHAMLRPWLFLLALRLLRVSNARDPHTFAGKDI